MIPLSAGIQLYSGAFFSYTDPGASDVTIEDIARNLSHVCRFAGACRRFYSVAQHAVNASLIVPQVSSFEALMHDLAEAFTNDLPTPLKAAFPVFKELEVTIETAMSKRFGFKYPMSPSVKVADLQMLKLEKEELKPHASGDWEVLNGVEVEHVRHLVDVGEMSSAKARRLFLERYEELRP